MTDSPVRPAPALLALALLATSCVGCSGDPEEVPGPAGPGEPPAGTPDGGDPPLLARPLVAPVVGYELVASYPHDPGAYTQGLLVVDGKLYESTGQRGASSLRLVDLETGRVEKLRNVESTYFAEGLAAYGGLLYQLTWKSRLAFVYDRGSMRRLDYRYTYDGEGWGLTTSPQGDEFVMSDGTSTLRFIDPKGFKETRRIQVTDGGRPIVDLNELEWIGDEIWANVWHSNRIARIDPEKGLVNSWVDLTGILGDERVARPDDDVLNGIAYDRDKDAIYVTGKRWPKLFQIRVE